MSFILCLGATGAGKTLLLKRLQNNPETDTIPTVGSNMITLKFGQRKKNTVVVRELGGTMAPIWNHYYSEASALMYVINTTDWLQISSAIPLFLDVLGQDSLRHCDCLLILMTKTHNSDEMSKLQQFKQVALIDNILHHSSQNITVVENDFFDDDGLETIKNWLLAHPE